MESHIFSVWGFMSILKSIQFNLSTTTLPWTPTDNTRNGLTNFINEIVLSEESDFIEGIGYTSHFEIYLDAMKEIKRLLLKEKETILSEIREKTEINGVNKTEIGDAIDSSVEDQERELDLLLQEREQTRLEGIEICRFT